MGYKTELNYILKSSTLAEWREVEKNLTKGSVVTITKKDLRVFMMNSPIMLADPHWNIVGMCMIQSAVIGNHETVLKAVVLSLFDENESKVVSKVIQEAEQLKGKYL